MQAFSPKAQNLLQQMTKTSPRCVQTRRHIPPSTPRGLPRCCSQPAIKHVWGQTAGSCCMARVCPDVARVMRDTQRLHHPLDSSQRVPPSALHPTSGCQHPEASSPPAQPPSHHVSASYRILQGQHHPNTRIRQRCHREGNYRSISLMIIDVKA